MNGNTLCLWREEGPALPVVRAVPGKAGNDKQRGLRWLGSSVLRPDQSRIPPSADIISNGNRSGGRLTVPSRILFVKCLHERALCQLLLFSSPSPSSSPWQETGPQQHSYPEHHICRANSSEKALPPLEESILRQQMFLFCCTAPCCESSALFQILTRGCIILITLLLHAFARLGI